MLTQVSDRQVNKSNTLMTGVRLKPYIIVTLIVQTIVILLSKIFFNLIFKYEIEGLENIKDIKGGIIFASNHQSELDPVVIPVSLPLFSRLIPFFYVSREKSFYKNSSWRKLIYGGTLFKICGAYPVQVGVHNYEKSLKNHIQILLDNQSVCIFPEGKRTHTGELNEAKGGVAFLSYKTGKPIIPVGISGLYKLSLKDLFFSRRTLKVSFGKAMYSEDLFLNPENIKISPERDDYRIIANNVLSNIRKLL